MGGDATRTHSSRLSASLPPSTALDTLYDYILAQLATSGIAGGLRATLERLCRTARLQDDALPLGLLPMWSYLAAGGHPWTRVAGVASAWRRLHLAGKLLNEAAAGCASALLPDEPVSGVLNVGTSLIFLSQAILCRATEVGATPTAVVALEAEFARAGLRAAAGQHARLHKTTTGSWDDYQVVVSARSGGPFALATRVGALVRWSEHAGQGTARSDVPAYVEALAQYGHQLGLMLQLADDFNGTWRPRGRSDLAAANHSWPLLYARSMGDADQLVQLDSLLSRGEDNPVAEARARTLLTQLDVPLAMIVAAEEHRAVAEAALAPLADSPARQALAALLRRITLAPPEVSPCP